MKKIIVAFAGEAGCGKDTAAKYFETPFYQNDERYRFTKIAFADPIKEMTCALLGVSREQLEDRSYKEGHLEHLNCSPRHIMQTIGTEWGREKIKESIWLDIMKQRILNAGSNVVITDVRFPNELDLIKSMGGMVIYIERPNNPSSTAAGHKSESAIKANECDRVIKNRGKIEDLWWVIDKTGYADMWN